MKIHKHTRYLKYIILALIGMTSCRQQQPMMYYTGNFESVINIAAQKKKPMWMILGGGKNCNSCENLIEDMEKKGIFKKYQEDYLFFRCNVEEPNNLFLKYIFLMEAIPNAYIVSPQGKVYSYISGQLTGNEVDKLLHLAMNNQPYTPSSHKQFKSDTRNLLYMQNLLISINLRQKNKTNDTLILASLLSDIKKTIDIEPYFYNLYLASQILFQMKDTLKANEYAKQALQICPDGFQHIVYHKLIHELENRITTHGESGKYAEIKFRQKSLNINNNKNGRYYFHFKNTGNIPLIIKHVSTSCQCALPVFDKHPILPGKEGKIEIQYQTEKDKATNKTIWIQSNAHNSIEKLTLTTQSSI